MLFASSRSVNFVQDVVHSSRNDDDDYQVSAQMQHRIKFLKRTITGTKNILFTIMWSEK